jgi:hypothetical protein
MKRIIFLTVLTVTAVTVLGVVLVQHYRTDINNKNAQKVVAQNSQITSLQSQLAAEKQKVARYEQAYQGQRIECEKGASNVVKVPPYLQKTFATPKCGPAVLAQ